MTHQFKQILTCVLLCCLITACDRKTVSSSTKTSTELKIFSVNYPLNYFAERIGGDFIRINFSIPAGIDPPYWEPTGDEIAEIQKTDIIILNGAGYSQWLPYASLSSSKQLNTSADFKLKYIAQNDDTHSHGPEGDHSHSNFAFTTWLDFSLALDQAQKIYHSFCLKLPSQKELFSKNFNSLKIELEGLHAKMLELGKSIDSQPIIASHPVYQYAARAYGLNIKSLHWEPDTIPGNKELEELRALLKSHPAKLMMWEAHPKVEMVNELKKLGIRSFVFAPAASRLEGRNFKDIMLNNIEKLRDAIEANLK